MASVLQVVEIGGQFAVLAVFANKEEAELHLAALNAQPVGTELPAADAEPSVKQRLDHLVAHLRHRGIDVDAPAPEPAKELHAPSPSLSTSVETIVPVKVDEDDGDEGLEDEEER